MSQVKTVQIGKERNTERLSAKPLEQSIQQNQTHCSIRSAVFVLILVLSRRVEK